MQNYMKTITRAREEESQLLGITTAMSQQLKLVPLLHTIMGTVTNILHADRTLFMYDNREDLWSHVAQGLDGVRFAFKDKGIAATSSQRARRSTFQMPMRIIVSIKTSIKKPAIKQKTSFASLSPIKAMRVSASFRS